MPRLLASTLLLLVTASAACASSPDTVSLELTVGQEPDTIGRDPAVARVDVTLTTPEGDVSLSASAAPGGTFDLGEIPPDRLFIVDATGTAADGTRLVRGRSLALDLDKLAGSLVPVFVQRLGSWARPSHGMPNAHLDAPAGVLGEQYLFSTGGSAAVGPGGSADPSSADFYDLFAYGSASSEPMDRVARSMVTRLGSALLIGDDGATVVDFDASASSPVPLPVGLASFADVAGGQVVETSAGASFVIGATRSTGTTAAVLAVGADGVISALSLVTPRAGAAAVWVEGVGLLVAGGSAEGAGIEVLAVGAMAFAGRGFPSDPVQGAAALVLATGEVALVGGLDAGGAPAATRTLDPRCGSACVATTSAVTLPVPLERARAFVLPGGRAMLIGSEAVEAGQTLAFEIDFAAAAVLDRPLREPRRGATPVAAPNGTLALVGGLHPDGSPALSVETWFPE